MSDEEPQGRERRAYTRYDVAYAIDFEVGDKAARLRGETINISLGGVLVDIGIKVPEEAICKVTFIDAGDAVAPTEISGKIVHVGMWKHGREAVAIQFDAPLQTLEPPDND